MAHEIKVPDIGGATEVDVIEILVKVGDEIQKDTSLLTLESDKASMEIPSPSAGVVEAIKLKVGDKVSEGDVILTLSTKATATEMSRDARHDVDRHPERSEGPSHAAETSRDARHDVDRHPERSEEPPNAAEMSRSARHDVDNAQDISAGPAARRLAHVLGVNLSEVAGTGRNGRVSQEDIEQFVKAKLSSPSSNATGFALPNVPNIDFSQFGTIETKPLNKIKRLTGTNVHRAWVTIPHVTQFDSADITDLEAFRQSEAARLKNADYKLTLLAFVCKVVSKALMLFPQFNASLDSKGEQLIFKQYYNIGIAVETPNGLVVPVIKGVDQLSVSEIAKEMSRLSTKAREKGLMPADMSGGSFTISSLGGIGGTAFTPIVNSPEVAILGLSRSSMQPVYQDGEFVPRLMLPLSLSYDHRVIDGAEGARFTRYLCESLSDLRRILL